MMTSKIIVRHVWLKRHAVYAKGWLKCSKIFLKDIVSPTEKGILQKQKTQF